MFPFATNMSGRLAANLSIYIDKKVVERYQAELNEPQGLDGVHPRGLKKLSREITEFYPSS